MKIYLFLIMMTLPRITHAKPLMIAHAGGGIGGQNYSNSIEALELNYNKGFRYFEIDFSWTSDNQLVCLHDWGKRFKQVFGFKTKHVLSSNQFQELLKNTDGLHPCTPSTLELWLKTHTDATIITDVKHDNLKAIQKIIQQYPHLISRLIPQFYQPDEYQSLIEMGFKHLIWILYQFEGKLSAVINHAKEMDLFAVSMRVSQAKEKCAQELIANGENIFVYTINKPKQFKKLIKKYHVSGIYTDFLDIPKFQL